MHLTRRPLLSVLALAAAAMAVTSTLAEGAPTPSDHGTRTPILSATARAHGLTPAYGAVPGWTQRHLAAARSTTAQSTTASVATAPLDATSTTLPASGVPGIDVSSWSGTVNWASFKQSGVRFAYVKATEGTYYVSSLEASQLAGARSSGIYVGTYHFANPSQSSGTAQADYFIAHGGGWTPGSLPGAVDLEWNPYSGTMCYNMTTTQMTSWISAFQLEYHRLTGIWPVIYTARPWWNTCVGNTLASAVIAARSDLWVSTSGATLGAMPYSWRTQRIWQYAYASSGYDLDLFNGSSTMLAAMTLAGR